jgi:hypothetical protein
MGYRVIAVISTFLTVKEALEFSGNYNRNTRGNHSAKLVVNAADDLSIAVHMLEHDSWHGAVSARAEQSGLQLCEWCGEMPASLAEGLCGPCWDQRERLKAEGGDR